MYLDVSIEFRDCGTLSMGRLSMYVSVFVMCIALCVAVSIAVYVAEHFAVCVATCVAAGRLSMYVSVL